MKRLLLLTLLIPLSISISKSTNCSLQNYNDDVISYSNYEVSFSHVDENSLFWKGVKELFKFLGKEIASSGISYSVEKVLDEFLYKKIKTHVDEIWNDKDVPNKKCHRQHFDSCEICQNINSIVSDLKKVDADILEALAANKNLSSSNQREIDNIRRVINETNAVSDARITKLEKDYLELKKEVKKNTTRSISNEDRIDILEGEVFGDTNKKSSKPRVLVLCESKVCEKANLNSLKSDYNATFRSEIPRGFKKYKQSIILLNERTNKDAEEINKLLNTNFSIKSNRDNSFHDDGKFDILLIF